MIEASAINEIIERFPLMMTLVIGGTLLSLLGLALRQLGMRSSAAQRHLILAVTAIGLAALPLIRVLGPELPVRIIPAGVAETNVVPEVSTRHAVANGPGSTPTPAAEQPERLSNDPQSSRTAASPSLPGPGSVVLLLYIGGMILVLVPLAAGTLRMRWLVGHAEPLSDDAGFLGDLDQLPMDEVKILMSDSIGVPLAWGWSRAVLLLPVEAIEWPIEMRRDAIIHELAHLERRDLLFQTVARVAVAIHWFNPLAWAVLRRLLLEAEQACDDRVLDAGTGTADYAERLLRIASGANHPSLRRLSAVAMARSSQLATRIEALFERSRKRAGQLSRLHIVGTFLVVLVPAVLVGAVQLEQRVIPEELQPSSSRSESWTDQDQIWARAGRNEIRLEPGSTARITGSGAILFRDGRRTMVPETGGTVLVDGRVADRETDIRRQHLEITGPRDRDHWVIEWSPGADPTREGTRVSDSSRDATARLDSTRETTFYIGVDSSGQAEFFKPEREARDGRSREWSDQWDEDGDADESPLYAAIRRGSLSMVEALLDAGADPNARWSGDGNPLIIAVRHGRSEIIELLLERGARPDEGVEGDGNALIVAAAMGDLWSLDRFIATGADIDRGVPGDGNPLIAASGNGQIQAMKLLVSHGADIEAVVPGDENPLLTASARGQLEAVKYLVSVGADVNARVPAWSRTGEGEMRTALSQARKGGYDELVRFLVSVGAHD